LGASWWKSPKVQYDWYIGSHAASCSRTPTISISGSPTRAFHQTPLRPPRLLNNRLGPESHDSHSAIICTPTCSPFSFVHCQSLRRSTSMVLPSGGSDAQQPSCSLLVTVTPPHIYNFNSFTLNLVLHLSVLNNTGHTQNDITNLSPKARQVLQRKPLVLQRPNKPPRSRLPQATRRIQPHST